MSAIFTPEEVAEHFKVSRRIVVAMASKGHWPHLRINRNQIRFTAEHIAEIEAQTVASSKQVIPLFDRKTRSLA